MNNSLQQILIGWVAPGAVVGLASLILNIWQGTRVHKDIDMLLTIEKALKGDEFSDATKPLIIKTQRWLRWRIRRSFREPLKSSERVGMIGAFIGLFIVALMLSTVIPPNVAFVVNIVLFAIFIPYLTVNGFWKKRTEKIEFERLKEECPDGSVWSDIDGLHVEGTDSGPAGQRQRDEDRRSANKGRKWWRFGKRRDADLPEDDDNRDS